MGMICPDFIFCRDLIKCLIKNLIRPICLIGLIGNSNIVIICQ